MNHFSSMEKILILQKKSHELGFTQKLFNSKTAFLPLLRAVPFTTYCCGKAVYYPLPALRTEIRTELARERKRRGGEGGISTVRFLNEWFSDSN